MNKILGIVLIVVEIVALAWEASAIPRAKK